MLAYKPLLSHHYHRDRIIPPISPRHRLRFNHNSIRNSQDASIPSAVPHEIIPLSNLEPLRWLKNASGNECIDLRYAHRITRELSNMTPFIGNRVDHRLMRENFTPASGIRWHLLDDPIIDYYYYKYREDPEANITRESDCEHTRLAIQSGLEFEQMITDTLQDISNVYIIDLVDVPMTERISYTRRALEDGADIILNSMVIGLRDGIYGSPDIIMRRDLMVLLDQVMGKYQKNLRYTPIESSQYVIIEIKYCHLKGTREHQYESKKMRYYQGQAHLYALALEEMLERLNIQSEPIESFILPSEIKRPGPPKINRPINTGAGGPVTYRNLSCIPVNRELIHEAVMEAISWNWFISRFVHEIDPVKMFISNSSSCDGSYNLIKTIHSIETGVIEYLVGSRRAIHLRDQGIRTIFDPKVTHRTLSLKSDRFNIMRQRSGECRAEIMIPSSIVKKIKDPRESFTIHYRDRHRGIMMGDEYYSRLYIRQKFQNVLFVVATSVEANRLSRELDIDIDSDIIVLSQILHECDINLPFMMIRKLFDISYAFYKIGLFDRYLYMTDDDRLKNDTMCINFIWDFLRRYVRGTS